MLVCFSPLQGSHPEQWEWKKLGIEPTTQEAIQHKKDKNTEKLRSKKRKQKLKKQANTLEDEKIETKGRLHFH
jgi:hypothetical protein